MACCVFATTLGCSGNGVVPVEGRVTLDGNPLSNATVVLSPLTGTGPGPFVGTSDAEGRFAIGTTGEKASGAAAGEYAVIITTVNTAEDNPPPTQQEIVPAHWRNGSQRFTVPGGGTKDANFEMSSR